MESIRMNQIGHSVVECLAVDERIIHSLQFRAEGIERATAVNEMLASVKCCPTRHGCKGATNCDCSYGDYHYGR